MTQDTLITDTIFAALIRCETKAHLMHGGVSGLRLPEYAWREKSAEQFRRSALERLTSNISVDTCHSGMPPLLTLEKGVYQLVLGPEIASSNLRSRPDALLRTSSRHDDPSPVYAPVRFVQSGRPSAVDKLLLAFDATVIASVTGNAPAHGMLVYGQQLATTVISLRKDLTKTSRMLMKFTDQRSKAALPPVVLNRHCPECEFESRCRAIALEQDDLSLLANMTPKERDRQNRRGIFTVMQLSYTFRARRRPKSQAAPDQKHNPSLKALAIRTNRIHVVGSPHLSVPIGVVYVDVEGTPDTDSYYLIGLRYKGDDGTFIYSSFWADGLPDERDMWLSCLQTLKSIKDVHLVHYGSYETQFMKRMKSRYADGAEDVAFVDQLITSSTNLLSFTYAQLYFPTYSNRLKEIAKYLGFAWSEPDASGLRSVAWRAEWEATRNSIIRQRLLIYNADDCEALQMVANLIADICSGTPSAETEARITNVTTLETDRPLKFGTLQYAVPDFKMINEAAYWNYQRNRIYIRSSDRLRRLSRKQSKRRSAVPPPINEFILVEEHHPDRCPKCDSTRFYRNGRFSHLIYDLRFSSAGVRRWVVRKWFSRYQCRNCKNGYNELPPEARFGDGLRAFILYQVIDVRISQRAVSRILNTLFGLQISVQSINRVKVTTALRYEAAYAGILKRIVAGQLAHADETKITIKGEARWVWVFTNLEEVAYVYSDSRAASTASNVLAGFKGVLVSDFFSGYDNIECAHQKCLIHLLRDINGDVLKEPFNNEMNMLAHEFAGLLRPMVETVDRFGLKAHHLRSHKRAVDRFYRDLAARDYQTSLAAGYKKRFEKNRERLFTFLLHDGIPWNNNNAEHAIKAFAVLRRAIEGTTTPKGIRDYLVLLSISETCRYKGIKFLDFLRSGQMDVDIFAR
jgi:predicted RecB family nuclease